MVDAFMFFLLKLSLIALGLCFLIVCFCVVIVLKWYRKSVEIKRRSRVYASHSHGAQGYLESLETGSAAVGAESHYQALARMETGMSRNLNLRGNESSVVDARKVKVASEDIPPQYETLSPPTYESLFPEDENMIPHLVHVNEKLGNINPG